jgi:hypothetical protein
VNGVLIAVLMVGWAAVTDAATAAAQLRPAVDAAAAARLERLRSAWLRHDAAAVVGESRVVLQLPGQGASAPLTPAQASRTVQVLFRDATELALDVTAVRSVDPETVYAELRRVYRVRGAAESMTQAVFVAFKAAGDAGWTLVELRAGDPTPP